MNARFLAPEVGCTGVASGAEISRQAYQWADELNIKASLYITRYVNESRTQPTLQWFSLLPWGASSVASY